jgi:Sulfotransferase family
MPATDQSSTAIAAVGSGPGSAADADGESSAERYLFIAGCPRSGTSALVFLLNEHPQIALGFERFKRTRALLDPFHFTPAQFFSPVLAETDIQGELLYRRLRERWNSGSVKVLGDKVPLYWRVLPELFARFPSARMILMVRELQDVAASFDRRARDPGDWWPAENDRTLAVTMWNEALRRARDAELAGFGEHIFLLPYEPLLAGEVSWLQAAMAFVGLPVTPRLRLEHHRLAQRWQARAEEPARAELISYVEAHQDSELLAWARERTYRQLQRASALRASDHLLATAALDESPLPAGQLAEREAEREQLLAEMRRPGARRPDEAEVLERRLLEQSGELARRGERLRGPTQLAPAGHPGSDGGRTVG